MSHQRHPSSASSYAPVLINPSQHTPPLQPTILPPPKPFLKYPYPLPLAATLDLGFTVHHAISHPISPFVITLCMIRVSVLGIVLGLSKRWRNRGGWIGVICGMTVGTAVWKICEGQLRQGEKHGEGGADGFVDAVFLITTAAIAAAEYILFLLLLRLSPPTHRLNPLALRLPRSAIQSPTVFDFHTSRAAIEGVDRYAPSPSSVRHQRHSRYPSQRTLLQPGSVPVASALPTHLNPSIAADIDIAANVEGLGSDFIDDDDYDPEFGYGYENDDQEDEDTLSDNETSSSISESSIIDLPPPLSPSRIIPPPSLSVNRGLNLYAAIDHSPVLGAVVRRTRSARFLGSSWGSASGSRYGDNDTDLGEDGGGTSPGGGYGTFGGRRQEATDRVD